MYTIKKIFNNNIILAIDNENIETILMGKGIGFSKSSKDSIQPDKVEKRFILQDPKMISDLGIHLANINETDYNMINEIVEYAKRTLDLDDYIYLSLSEHLEFLLKRLDKDLILGNPLGYEIQNLYPDEYRIGLEAIKIVEQTKCVPIPHNEASSIALLLLNSSKRNASGDQLMADIELIRDIIEIISKDLDLDIKKPSLTFERFIVHLKFFVWKIKQQNKAKSKNIDLFKSLKVEWSAAYNCVLKVFDYVVKERGIKINDEQLFYLMIHIQRLSMRSE